MPRPYMRHPVHPVHPLHPGKFVVHRPSPAGPALTSERRAATQRRRLNPRSASGGRRRCLIRRAEQEPAVPAAVHGVVVPRQPGQLQQRLRSATSAIQHVHVNLPVAPSSISSGAVTKIHPSTIADWRTYVQVIGMRGGASTAGVSPQKNPLPRWERAG